MHCLGLNLNNFKGDFLNILIFFAPSDSRFSIIVQTIHQWKAYSALRWRIHLNKKNDLVLWSRVTNINESRILKIQYYNHSAVFSWTWTKAPVCLMRLQLWLTDWTFITRSGGHPLEISVVFLLHCYFIKHLWFTINRGKWKQNCVTLKHCANCSQIPSYLHHKPKPLFLFSDMNNLIRSNLILQFLVIQQHGRFMQSQFTY